MKSMLFFLMGFLIEMVFILVRFLHKLLFDFLIEFSEIGS